MYEHACPFKKLIFNEEICPHGSLCWHPAALLEPAAPPNASHLRSTDLRNKLALPPSPWYNHQENDHWINRFSSYNLHNLHNSRKDLTYGPSLSHDQVLTVEELQLFRNSDSFKPNCKIGCHSKFPPVYTPTEGANVNDSFHRHFALGTRIVMWDRKQGPTTGRGIGMNMVLKLCIQAAKCRHLLLDVEHKKGPAKCYGKL